MKYYIQHLKQEYWKSFKPRFPSPSLHPFLLKPLPNFNFFLPPPPLSILLSLRVRHANRRQEASRFQKRTKIAMEPVLKKLCAIDPLTIYLQNPSPRFLKSGTIARCKKLGYQNRTFDFSFNVKHKKVLFRHMINSLINVWG